MKILYRLQTIVRISCKYPYIQIEYILREYICGRCFGRPRAIPKDTKKPDDLGKTKMLPINKL